MPDRFFYPGKLDAEPLNLDGSEAHHLLNVLRAKRGDRVELFNGAGDTATAVVDDFNRREVTLTLESVQSCPRPAGPILLTAVPKGDRFRWLVEKAVELGVERLIPLITERSSVIPRDAKLEKMEQTVIAACKQSRRNWLMPIEGPQRLSDAIEICKGRSLYVAHPGGSAIGESRGTKPPAFAIGPEGGFTDNEIDSLISRGATVVSFGEEILRTETAAVAFAAWWRIGCT